MLYKLRRRLHDFVGLGTFVSLHDLELDVVAFLQALVTIALDGAVVHEDIRTVFAADESVALGVIEPLDLSFVLSHRPPPSLHREKYATGEVGEDGDSPRSYLCMT